MKVSLPRAILDKSSFMSGFCFLFSKELQQTFFKEVMSLFQDLVDQQTDKLTTDTGKVNGRKAEPKLYYLCNILLIQAES